MRQQLLFLSLFGGVLALPLVVAPAQEPRSPGPGPGPGRSGTMLAEIDRLVEGMMAFDADKNGRVTRAELTDNRLLGLFDRADIDKDGTVTKEELTLLAEREYVPSRGFGGGPGGPGGPGGFGGPGGPPMRPGEILSAPLQQRLGLSADQKAKLAELQADVDARLAKILSADQMAQLKQMRDRGPGGPGGPGGGRRGGPDGPPPGGPQD